MEVFYRNFLNADWVIVLFFFIGLLILTAKRSSNYKFSNFCQLIFTNTYLKTYKEDSLSGIFHLVFVAITLLLFPLGVLTFCYKLNLKSDFSFTEYLRISAIFIMLYSAKFLIQILLGYVLQINEKVKKYTFEKQTYFSYILFIYIIPIVYFLFAIEISFFVLYLFVILWVVLFVLAMFLVVFNFKEVFFKHPFYFILYICTFEIAPIVLSIYFIKWL